MALIQKGENLVRVKNVGQVGVIKDLPPDTLPMNAWTDAWNIRFKNNVAMKSWTYKNWIAPSWVGQSIMYLLGAKFVHTEFVSQRDKIQEEFFYSTKKGIYGWRDDGTTTKLTTRTYLSEWTANSTPNPTFFWPDTKYRNTFTSCVIGGVVIINNSFSILPPQYIKRKILPTNSEGTSSNLPFNLIPRSDGSYISMTTCHAIRNFKDIVIMLHPKAEVDSTGTRTNNPGPYTVWWSHPADPNNVPPSWDVADATKSAGMVFIMEGTDAVVDGLSLLDSFIVYKENSTWSMDYIGGNDIFRTRKIFADSGVIGVNCVVEMNNQHFVVTKDDIITHNGQFQQSILNQKDRDFFFRDMNQSNAKQTFAVQHPAMKEIWVCYTNQPGDVACNKALVWNYDENTVGFRSLVSMELAPSGINHATVWGLSILNSGASATWGNQGGTWDEQIGTWDGNRPYTTDLSMIGGSDEFDLIQFDFSGNSDEPCFLEKTDISFDRPELIKQLRGIRAHISGSVGRTVVIKVGSQKYAGGPVTWEVIVDHVIGETIANDFMLCSRYFAIRFEGGTAAQWSMTGYELDVVLISEV